MQSACVVAVLLLSVALLQLGNCRERMAQDNIAPLQNRLLNKRSGGSNRERQCCTQDALDTLQSKLKKDLKFLTLAVAELSFQFQEFTHPGQNSLHPAYSCQQIYNSKPASPSGYYWLRGPQGHKDAHAAHVYCHMQTDTSIFGATQGWLQVANLDLDDPYQQCPKGFKLITHPVRACVKKAERGCSSILFPTHYIQYQRVCGRMIGYQVGSNNAFHRFECDYCGIDDPYVDGVSVTHGKHPRKHIWSFAANWVEKKHDYPAQCPCARNSRSKAPKFVGNDYFCETGEYSYDRIDVNDPLWDGEGCGKKEKKCCEQPGLPWFCKDLPHPTTDDIEVRVCGDEKQKNEDVWMNLIQLYVQ